MSKRPGANKANLEETQRVFLEIAREEFCEHGYAGASTSRIVEKSGMARGSLYYHFGDKCGLFHAVYKQEMQRTVEHVSTLMDAKADPWEAFLAGSNAFIDLCMRNNFRKIILIESQSAISFKDRMAIQEETLLGKLRSLIPALLERGYFAGHTEKTAAIFMFGVLGEIGRSFDLSENIEKDREAYGRAYLESFSKTNNK